MKNSLPYIAIISIGAFAGNMINIGLSYGLHWQSLAPVDFMTTFAVDFPLLLAPTMVTLLPAFVASIASYFSSNKGTETRRNWLYTFVGLLIINIQTAAYHLPLNLQFMAQSVDLSDVEARLTTWLIFHWVRIIVAIVASVFAIKAFESSLKNR
ncbi:MAG: anthrone oxygenase family protein [Chloroflexota bacterium]